ncbi:hypothetical protein LJK87_47565 [Paenibacillus sp. P25]|nr:hypothetical protein LJK87_47565 [Paenibacillus sp. P25]
MEHLQGTYCYPLVVLSVLISGFSSYCALDLYENMAYFTGRAKAVWRSLGSVAMGLGIGSMHFIGTVAYHLPVKVGYDAAPIVFSLLLAGAGFVGFLWHEHRSTPECFSEICGRRTDGNGNGGNAFCRDGSHSFSRNDPL